MLWEIKVIQLGSIVKSLLFELQKASLREKLDIISWGIILIILFIIFLRRKKAFVNPKDVDEKENESGEKNINKKESRSAEKRINKKNVVLFFMVASIVIIGFTELLFLKDISSKLLTANEEILEEKSDAYTSIAESSFVGTGIAVVSVAIAVWAGLNIIDAMERNELKEAKEKIEVLENEVDILTKDINSVDKRWRFSLKNMFCDELEKDDLRILSEYFHNSFSAKNIDCVFLYRKLYNIERNFKISFSLHLSSGASNLIEFDKSIENIFCEVRNVEAEVEKEENDLKSDEKKLLQTYLVFMEGEAFFLRGYCKKNEEQYSEFKKAAELFMQISKDVLGKDINEITQKILDGIKIKVEASNVAQHNGIEIKSEEIIIDKMMISALIFFLNTLGESYSKMLQCAKSAVNAKVADADQIKEIMDKSAKFLKAAVILSDKTNIEKTEVKSRNLGCAYERAENYEGSVGERKDNILGSYLGAFKLVLSETTTRPDRVQNVYSTTLKYCEKYIKFQFEYTYKPFKENENYQNWFKIVTGSSKKAQMFRKDDILCEDVKKYQVISSLAIADHPRHTVQRGLHGLALTWVMVFLIYENRFMKRQYPEELTYYLRILWEDIRFLDVMEDTTDFTEDLKNRYRVFCDYLNID